MLVTNKTNAINNLPSARPQESMPICSPVSLKTADGVGLHLDHVRPTEITGAAILVTPAMGAPARAYRRLGHALADSGHAVGILDPRGIGESDLTPSRNVDFGVREFLEQDWQTAVEWLRENHPATKTILLGHSFGGQLNSIYAGKHPEEVDALINLCAVWLHFREMGSITQQAKGLIFFSLMRACAEVIGFGPGDKLGWGARFAKQHVRDWSSWGLDGKYMYRGGNARECLRQVTQPTLAVSFTDDDTLGPGPAWTRFCDEMAASEMTRWRLRPEDVGKSKAGHFGALKDADPLWEKIDAWIRASVLDG
ncbi:alpha/beta hydrolase family protein [Qipengyuania sp. DGS5-3]|uniref:alpha/beta hydrolase family protein n=1 Tax=Qipengyuania sp. DGS5-3 TaxID=3349632 RepID=UPI0036D3A496